MEGGDFVSYREAYREIWDYKLGVMCRDAGLLVKRDEKGRVRDLGYPKVDSKAVEQAVMAMPGDCRLDRRG